MDTKRPKIEDMFKIHIPHDAYALIAYAYYIFMMALFKVMYQDQLKHFDLTTIKYEPTDISTVGMRRLRPDGILTCLMSMGANIIAPFIWEFKSYVDPETIIQLLDYCTTFIHRHMTDILSGTMRVPCVTLITQGARNKLSTLENLCKIKDPTGLFRAPKIFVKIFDITKVPDRLIEAGWPWTFPIFVMKYYNHSNIVNLLSEKISDLLINHNKDHFFSQPVADALLYIGAVRGQEVHNEICKKINLNLRGANMELDPEIKDRTENFFLRTLQEGIQEGMQKGKQEGIQE
ncbi:MAG: Rpn family recombination-promoting nuclease/putative transposase, partial [Desulfovibrio sp.]|nr:Rpn family recombination-promoting nuclease/putative transposase [Desulfovibrio sp.]